MSSENPEAFYSRLKEELLKSTRWPADYLYKFIIPTDSDKKDQIHSIFNNKGAVIQSKKSKNGKYTSVSITVNLKDPEEVISYYKKVGKIDGVISL